MQQKIEELKQQIEALKQELIALPSVEEKSGIEDLQLYLKISTELMKAVAGLQVIQNVEEASSDLDKPSEPIEQKMEPIDEPKTKPEFGILESAIQQPIEAPEEPEIIVQKVESTKPTQKQSSSAQPSAEGDLEVAEMLANHAISDLKSAFGLNERFYFTNELFKGDGQEFIRAVNEFNHLGSFEDATRLIEAKYIPQFGWKEDNEVVIEFVTMIKRRYS